MFRYCFQSVCTPPWPSADGRALTCPRLVFPLTERGRPTIGRSSHSNLRWKSPSRKLIPLCKAYFRTCHVSEGQIRENTLSPRSRHPRRHSVLPHRLMKLLLRRDVIGPYWHPEAYTYPLHVHLSLYSPWQLTAWKTSRRLCRRPTVRPCVCRGVLMPCGPRCHVIVTHLGCHPLLITSQQT